MKTLIAFSLLVVACRANVVPDPWTIAQKNWTFIPPYPWSPTVRLDITYNSQNFEFIYCCRRYSTFGRTIDILPPTPIIYRPVEFQQRPWISLNWQMTTSDYNVTTNYTLVMVDPDTPRAGARDLPRIHWIVANLNMKAQWNNHTIASYSGPHPPDQKPHHYVFLLYEQLGGKMVNATAMNASIPASRSLFNVTSFADKFSLNLKGISWFKALNDEYVNYTKIMRDNTVEPMYCAGKFGWSQYMGCTQVSASGSDNIAMTLSLFVVTFMALAKIIH